MLLGFPQVESFFGHAYSSRRYYSSVWIVNAFSYNFIYFPIPFIIVIIQELLQQFRNIFKEFFEDNMSIIQSFDRKYFLENAVNTQFRKQKHAGIKKSIC